MNSDARIMRANKEKDRLLTSNCPALSDFGVGGAVDVAVDRLLVHRRVHRRLALRLDLALHAQDGGAVARAPLHELREARVRVLEPLLEPRLQQLPLRRRGTKFAKLPKLQ